MEENEFSFQSLVNIANSVSDNSSLDDAIHFLQKEKIFFEKNFNILNNDDLFLKTLQIEKYYYNCKLLEKLLKLKTNIL
jgi:hypothetical protein